MRTSPSVDDFGTGYSSLSYLQDFAFGKIKIDQTFISRIGDSFQAGAIIHAILKLGRTLALPVIAEGVETEEQGAPRAGRLSGSGLSDRPAGTDRALPASGGGSLPACMRTSPASAEPASRSEPVSIPGISFGACFAGKCFKPSAPGHRAPAVRPASVHRSFGL
jgi:diguanylate cyclase